MDSVQKENKAKSKSMIVVKREGSSRLMTRDRKIHEVKDSYDCIACPAVFCKASQLKHHSKLHMNKEKAIYECDDCHVILSSRSKLFLHKIKIHEEELKCDFCDSTFSCTRSFKLHARVHSRPFECNECGSKFVQSSNLQIHKRVHTGEKPYQCDICKQAFTQISHLKSHERIHSQTKPYTCELCGHSFIQKCSLNRHMLTHTGEKSHVCDICQAAFHIKSNLDRHGRTVHSKTLRKTFKCSMCDCKITIPMNSKRKNPKKGDKCQQCLKEISNSDDTECHICSYKRHTPIKCKKCITQFINEAESSILNGNETPGKLAIVISHEDIEIESAVNGNLLRPTVTNEQKYSGKLCEDHFKDFRNYVEYHDLVSDPSVEHRNAKEDNKQEMSLTYNKYSPVKATNALATQNSVQDINCHAFQNGNKVISHAPVYSYPSTPVGLPVVQSYFQSPVPMIVAPPVMGAAMPMKVPRINSLCQNHSDHTTVMTASNQIQTWCLCQTPNNPGGHEVATEHGIPSHRELKQLQQIEQISIRPLIIPNNITIGSVIPNLGAVDGQPRPGLVLQQNPPYYHMPVTPTILLNSNNMIGLSA